MEVRAAWESTYAGIAKRREAHYADRSEDIWNDWFDTWNFPGDIYGEDSPSLFGILPYIQLEYPQVKRIWERAWKRGQNQLAVWSSPKYPRINKGLAEAIFAPYPSSTKDLDLVKIMADRGCTVFDFLGWPSVEPPQFLYEIQNVLGLSLLHCPPKWCPQLLELAMRNSNILGITLSSFTGKLSGLPKILAENRKHWAERTPIPEGEDTISWFGLTSYPVHSDVTAMRIDLLFDAPGVLVFKTEQAGTLRVHLFQKLMRDTIQVTWRLDNAEDWSLVEMKRDTSDTDGESQKFQHDSFPVEVLQPGVHQIDIIFKSPKRNYYDLHKLRRVWVSLPHNDVASPDEGVGDEESNEEWGQSSEHSRDSDINSETGTKNTPTP